MWPTLLIVSLVVVYLLRIPTRWRYRHIPGPLGFPVVGSLVSLIREGAPKFFENLHKRYGAVCKVWLGPQPAIIISDHQLGRRVLGKTINRNRSPKDLIATGEQAEVEASGILVARDNKWKTLHAAWLPAFSSGSLAGYIPLMDDCAQQLCHSVLDVAAASGQVIDIWRELGRMTLQVVGSTAYGVDFHTLDTSSEAGEKGLELVQACQDVFRLSSISFAGIYVQLAVAFPELWGILSFLAKRFPDRALMELAEARAIVRNQCLALIGNWKATHQKVAEDDQVEFAPGGMKQDEVAARPEDHKPSKPVAPTVKPGSFLGLMLAARDGETGEKLTDAEIIAQVNTFLIGGYETTASALAYTVFCLCCHEEAEEKLVKEVDALGREGPITPASLEKLPYTTACFNEAIRLYPPAGGAVREAKADMMVGHVPVPKGSTLIVSSYNMHHDPAMWPNVEEFQPERFLEDHKGLMGDIRAHLPFGAGSRMCIGSRFAIQEAKICLVRLYQKYRFKLEAGQVPLQTVWGMTMTPAGVRVTVHRRE